MSDDIIRGTVRNSRTSEWFPSCGQISVKTIFDESAIWNGSKWVSIASDEGDALFASLCAQSEEAVA